MGHPPDAAVSKTARLVSLDAYRGLAMLLTAAGAVDYARKAALVQENRFLTFLVTQLSHADWSGCTFRDLTQPGLLFIVGVAIPYSVASRRARGESRLRIGSHVVYRCLILVLLGIFLASNGQPQTTFVFDNVLAQIGLASGFVYLLLGAGRRIQLLAIAGILAGYWYLFARHPLPGPDFDYAAVGVGPEDELFTGFFAHWNKNVNFAADFDRWFLNLFPRPEPFRYNTDGYQTLNFVPSIATMLFGLMAGERLREAGEPRQKLRSLLLAGAVCLGLGLALCYTVCPSVKRIWTPAFTLISAGWVFGLLASFYWVIDLRGYRRWAFPLVVVGMNPLTLYILAQLASPWIRATFQTHFGPDIFKGLYGAMLAPVVVLSVLWLSCLWLYHRKIFVRL
jgi:predicted acyltransferase